jgi:hypothetical protein
MIIIIIKNNKTLMVISTHHNHNKKYFSNFQINYPINFLYQFSIQQIIKMNLVAIKMAQYFHLLLNYYYYLCLLMEGLLFR